SDGLCPLRGVLDRANPLIREAPKHDVGRHVKPPLRATFPSPRRGESPHPARPTPESEVGGDSTSFQVRREVPTRSRSRRYPSAISTFAPGSWLDFPLRRDNTFIHTRVTRGTLTTSAARNPTLQPPLKGVSRGEENTCHR